MLMFSVVAGNCDEWPGGFVADVNMYEVFLMMP